MRSRRALLASVGTVCAAGLAGCGALPFGGEEDDPNEDVSLPPDAVAALKWPDSPFPVAVPSRLAASHRERARELLADVPEDPSVPNAAVTAELRSERQHAEDDVEADADAPWPVDGLSSWRHARDAAASMRGAYRAATGEDDAATVAERRTTVLDELGDFRGDHAYRAASPVEAVLVHEPIEDLLRACRGSATPQPSYPEDPLARPFRAGETVGDVERARASLTDAGRLRERYLAERSETSPQWTALIDGTERLGLSVAQTESTVAAVVEADDPPFDADLEGTAGRRLFTAARRAVDWRKSEFEASLADGEYATAAIEAGQTLAAVETLRTAIDGIRDGGYQGTVSVESATRTAERAREAIHAVEDGEYPLLATRLLRPALQRYETVSREIESSYDDPPRRQGELAWAELYARSVPPAASFLVDRLAASQVQD